MAGLNRRSFITAAASGAAAAFASSVAAAAEKGMSNPCNLPTKWDEEFDVVVIGAGFAGLAAAYEAKKGGKSVVVLEKMPVAGGNSAICGGKMTATGCPQQKKHQIEDSIDLMMEDTFRAGTNMNDPEKVKYLAEHQLEVYNWTVNELGVKWAPNDIFQDGGHTVPRSVWSANGSGSGIVNQQLAKLKELGVKPRVRTYVEHLIRDPETGEMLGVEVREGYRFPRADSGKVKFIRAKKAVVAAWGGFSADTVFRQIHDPRLTPNLQNTNQPGATGELWREAGAVGVAMIMLDAIQCVPFSNPNEKGFGVAWQFSQNAAGQFGLWVNSDGKRFVNELANRKVSSDEMFVQQGKGKRLYAIGTLKSCKGLLSFQPDYIKNSVKIGAIGQFDSVEELCKANNLPVKEVQGAIDQVNESVKTGTDKVWRRYIDKEFEPLTEGPWLIAEMSPKVHHCMGGIKTDVNGQAIDVRTDKPIKGFYAAGECTGGSHGTTRLGCNGVLDALAYGRQVGMMTAKL